MTENILRKRKEIWALYLPQFYETEENNKWWGKGYTEWTSVRAAKPLFDGHEQPQIPLNQNYYDLSNVEEMRRQAELAKQYGVSNFVMFHYWYEGVHLLEKPAEQLLEAPDIDFPFCFCWANHSWTRAWDGKDTEILMEQTYGELEEWEAHLQYLLPFFRDARYTKIDNMPVLFIYRAGSIYRADERIEYWNERLREEGFSGLYVVEYINTFNHKPSLEMSQAVFEDEPNYTCRFELPLIKKAVRLVHKKTKTIDYQNFDYICRLMLKKNRTYGGRMIFQGMFGAWDNSPRKGKNSRILTNASPEKMQDYLIRLLSSSRSDVSNIVVYNAWNEWGEGAVLEPTEQHGYAYLEAIRTALAVSNAHSSPDIDCHDDGEQ